MSNTLITYTGYLDMSGAVEEMDVQASSMAEAKRLLNELHVELYEGTGYLFKIVAQSGTLFL